MKKTRLSHVLLVSAIGLLGYSAYQSTQDSGSCIFRAVNSHGASCHKHNSLCQPASPESVFLSLLGEKKPNCSHDIGPSCTQESFSHFANITTRASCDEEEEDDCSVIPPYLLQELKLRTPNNPFIINTINLTTELDDHGMFLSPARLSGNAAGNGKVEVYDAKTEQQRPGEKARFEGEGPTGDKEVDDCYDFNMQIRKFYKDVHSRNSIDNQGMKMVSTVNFGVDFNNAFWDGSQMTYGRPGASSPFQAFVLLDIAAHEVTHGVTQKESNLIYFGQSGALNESLSDIYGCLIVQHVKKQKADQANWLVGDGIWKKGIKGKALRDMLNPGTAYDDPKVGKDPQPAHMKDYIKTRADNGGVHYNSGIPNRAFATFAKAVGGYAWEEPGQIWYKARKLAGKQPSFAQFANKTLEAAKSLGYEKDLEKLETAWKTVGVTPSATAPDNDTPKFDFKDDGVRAFLSR